MKIRLKTNREEIGSASGFNVHAVFEVHAYFEDGDADTMRPIDLEAWIEALGEWKCMSAAFGDNDIIPDNYNTHFREPHNAKERERGWY